jgi:hypothetical protein
MSGWAGASLEGALKEGAWRFAVVRIYFVNEEDPARAITISRDGIVRTPAAEPFDRSSA